MTTLDDILVITVNHRVPNPECYIFRVLTREHAYAMFPAYINADGLIPLGITCDRKFTIHTAASLLLTEDLAHSLLHTHSELIMYEQNFVWNTDKYQDFLIRFRHYASEAVQHMSITH